MYGTATSGIASSARSGSIFTRPQIAWPLFTNAPAEIFFSVTTPENGARIVQSWKPFSASASEAFARSRSVPLRWSSAFATTCFLRSSA